MKIELNFIATYPRKFTVDWPTPPRVGDAVDLKHDYHGVVRSVVWERDLVRVVLGLGQQPSVWEDVLSDLPAIEKIDSWLADHLRASITREENSFGYWPPAHHRMHVTVDPDTKTITARIEGRA